MPDVARYIKDEKGRISNVIYPSGIEVKAVYGPEDLEAIGFDYAQGPGQAGHLPLHPQQLRRGLPLARVDHPPVRRLRHAQRHQRALQVPHRQRPDRPQRGLRPAHADGHRLRRSPGRGRGGPGGHGHRLPARLRDRLRRHRPAQGGHRPHHQRRGLHHDGHVRGRGREVRLRHRQDLLHPPERHHQGGPGPGRLDLQPRRRREAHRRHHRVRHHRAAPHLSGVRLRLPHPRESAPPPPRRWPTPSSSPTPTSTKW